VTSKNSLVWMVGFACSVPLFFILMACLWEYRILVGASLLLLIFLVVGVYVRGQVTEQNLRIYRFDHTRETPLDATGEPRFWRQDMKENTHRITDQSQMYYQGYQQYQER
jgi:hypothetical protein